MVTVADVTPTEPEAKAALALVIGCLLGLVVLDRLT
jgi:hypothetical protein